MILKKRTGSKRLYLLLVFFIIGCSDNQNKPKVLITGILSTSSEAMLDVRQFPDTLDTRTKVIVAYYLKAYISDATVTISNNEQTIKLDTVNYPEVLCYVDVHNQLAIIPGNVYALRVELNDGRIFESETRVPELPEIQFPINGDTVKPGSVFNIRYVYSDQFGYYPFKRTMDSKSFVQLFKTTGYYGETEVSGYSYAIAPIDTLNVLFSSGHNLMHIKVDYYTLDSSLSYYSWRLAKTHFGVDSAYNALYMKYSDGPIEKYSNIRGEGGVGCFGSFSHASFEAYFQNHP